MSTASFCGLVILEQRLLGHEKSPRSLMAPACVVLLIVIVTCEIPIFGNGCNNYIAIFKLSKGYLVLDDEFEANQAT